MKTTPNDIIDAVREDPDLQPIEKETIISFAKIDGEAHVYTESGGIIRRLLKHPEFRAVELRVNVDGAWGRRVAPADYSGGEVTGVKGYIPVGTLKIQARSRSNSTHASVVSKDAAQMAGDADE